MPLFAGGVALRVGSRSKPVHHQFIGYPQAVGPPVTVPSLEHSYVRVAVAFEG